MTRLLRVLAAVLMLAAGTTACTVSEDETVIVLSSWANNEQDAFVNHVLAEFTRQTGVKVQFRQATRALDQELRKDLQTGTQPHIAVLASPGQLATFAAQGALQPLDETLKNDTGQYGAQWLSVAGAIQPAGQPAHRYALPIKVNLKSAIWYNPTAIKQLLGQDWKPPATWAELISLTAAIQAKGRAPWCVGMESTPVSGWPGTDWIEDLLLHQSGPAAYEQWANGAVSWQDQLPQAFAAWGEIAGREGAINGGTENALLTGFAKASEPLFTPQPGCYLDHTAFIDNSDNTLRPGVDFDFFPFPAVDPQHADTYEVAANFAAMFRRTPQAEKLMQFLASDAGQRIWPAIPGRGAFSANRNVPLDVYPDPVSRRVAQILTQSKTVCFDGSDLMPPSLFGAFNQAMLTFLSNPEHYRNPDELGKLLANLDKVRTAVYPDGPSNFRCGQS